MNIEEFDTVLLKDGQTAAIVDKLSEDTFIADIGDLLKTGIRLLLQSMTLKK